MPSTTSCSRCGNDVASGARFCPGCGNVMAVEEGGVATDELEALVAPKPSKSQSELLQKLRRATIGEYEIFGELGHGGMAVVYLAHDIMLERKVAIKVMLPSVTSEPGNVERFKREARTSAKLSHPNIIPIHAVRETGDFPFFVMKYVEGRPLDSIIREIGQLPVKMIQTILTQVGRALYFAHRAGVVHRDVKPSNVMIDTDGFAIVTDFGIAKVLEAKTLTQTGSMVGTPSYMSPEQGTGVNVTGASDQYSLGVMGYEMLTGKPPFIADSAIGVIMMHISNPPPPIDLIRPDCPQPLRDAIMRMLAKEPTDRWPTMLEAVAALGLAPMAHDDPVIGEMGTLAKSGNQLRLDAILARTPGSPSPLGRRGRRPATAAVGKPIRRWIGIAGTVVAVTLAGVLARTRLLSTGTVADPNRSALQTDSTLGGTAIRSDTTRPDLKVVASDSQSGPSGDSTKPKPDSSIARPIQGSPQSPAELKRVKDSVSNATHSRDSLSALRRTRDSIAAVRKRDSIAAASVAPPPRTGKAWVKIGARRAPPGILSVNGVDQGVGEVSLRYVQVNSGTVHVLVQSTKSEGCAPFDSSFTIAPGDTVTIGYRNPKCSP